MDVVETTWGDGSVSYQITSATEVELAAVAGQADPNGWIKANATVTATTTAPTPPPVAPAVAAEQAAATKVASMASTIAANVTQAQADAATIGGIVPGEPLTQAHVDALQRVAAGWATWLDDFATFMQSQPAE